MNLDQLIDAAIKEDIPYGDLTTSSLPVNKRFGEAHLVAKEDIVLSGRKPFEETVYKIEPEAKINWNFDEGDLVLNKQVIAVIEGNLLQILKAERIALNFLGHLSGIATLTKCFVKKVEHTSTQILDTRKTLPGYRELQKQAVLHGGGRNHRMNLSDAILIKENHILVAGGITSAVEKIRQQTSSPIEVEVKNFDEAKEAIELRVQRIMLDNMTNEEMEKIIEITPTSIETEASGNMSIDRVSSVAELGVNYISVGALTHSAPTADTSLLFLWNDSDTDL